MSIEKPEHLRQGRVTLGRLILIIGGIFCGGFLLTVLCAVSVKASLLEIGGAAILFIGLFLSWVFALFQLKKKNPEYVYTLLIDPTAKEQKEEEKRLGIEPRSHKDAIDTKE